MARGKKKFALIWWITSQKTDVIPLSHIPNKKQHHVNAISTLTWENYETKEKSRETAKILAISQNEDELNKMIVTNQGELHDVTKQIFAENVLKKQNEMKEQEKLVRSIAKSNKNRDAVAIGRDRPILHEINSRSQSLHSPNRLDTNQHPSNSPHPTHSTAEDRLGAISPGTSHHPSQRSINRAQLHHKGHRFAPYSLHSKVLSDTQQDNTLVERTLRSPSAAPEISNVPAPHTAHRAQLGYLQLPPHSSHCEDFSDGPQAQKIVDGASYVTSVSSTDRSDSLRQPSGTSNFIDATQVRESESIFLKTSNIPAPNAVNQAQLGCCRLPSYSSHCEDFSDGPQAQKIVDGASYVASVSSTDRSADSLRQPSGALNSIDATQVGESESIFLKTSNIPAPNAVNQAQLGCCRLPSYSSHCEDFSDGPQAQKIVDGASYVASVSSTDRSADSLRQPSGALNSIDATQVGESDFNFLRTSNIRAPNTVNQAQLDCRQRPSYSSHCEDLSDGPQANKMVDRASYFSSVSSADRSQPHRHAFHSSSPTSPSNGKLVNSISPMSENRASLNSLDQPRRSPHRIIDSDSSTDSSACSEKNSQPTPLSYKIDFGTITKRDIEFQEKLLKAMKDAYEKQAKTDVSCKENLPVQAYYLKPGNDRAEISENCGFYLPKNKINEIELKSTMNDDWKILVRETLLEVYGNSIANFSATGKRGNRPAIDIQLFKGIQEWVTRTATSKPSKKKIIEFINKMASNKRKYHKSGKIKSSSTQNHTTKGVIVRKDNRPPVHHHDHNNLPPAILHQGPQRDGNSSESAAGVSSVNTDIEHRNTCLELPEISSMLTTSAEILNNPGPIYPEYLQI